MKRKVRWMFLGLLLTASAVYGQAADSAPKERRPLYQSETGTGKTGYVDISVLLNQHPAMAAAVATLQDEVEKKKPERMALITALQQFKKNGSGRLDIEAQWEKIKTYDAQTQAALDARQTEIFASIFDSIDAAVKAYAVKNNYAAVYVEPHPDAGELTAAVLEELKK